MSLEELWELFPITLKPYGPEYKIWYEEEKDDLAAVLKEYGIFRVSHIGSTAIEGLIAKPVVDILLELKVGYNKEEVIRLLSNSGWTVMARDDLAGTIDLNKGYTREGFAERVFHLHIKPPGDWGEFYFRDYLRKYPEIARQYEALKLRLKEQFEHNRDAYTEAKSDFIQKYTQKARNENENEIK